jgi:hypothetical protein
MMAMRLRSTTLGRKRIANATTIPMPNGFRFRPNGITTNGYKGNPTKAMAFSSSSLSSSYSSSSSLSFLGRLWESYTKALIARPLLVKGGAASLIFLASDAATQKIMMDPDDETTTTFDASRALSGAGFGVVATCWLHYWWGFLEVVVNKRLPVGAYGQNKMVNALGKVVADQLAGAPLYIYSYYCITHFGKEWMKLSSNIMDESDNNMDEQEAKYRTTTEAAKSTSDDHRLFTLAKETSDRALEMLPDTLLRHWTLWPIVHTFNFYYNPLHHRVLVQNIVLIFWSGYLSHLNNGGLDVVTPEKEIELVAEEHKQRDSARAGLYTKATSTTTTTGRDTPLARTY